MIKKIRNIAFIIIINLSILALIEILFRLFGVGADTSLLYSKEINGKETLYLNNIYTYKYYSTTNIIIPAPDKYLFPREKPDSIFRIYVIGESTSRGFPYSKTESFPYMLNLMLNNAGTGKIYEVINFSIDATNSYTGTDIAKELVKYPPDLAIIYYGNNEFIGIGGGGSFKSVTFRLNKLMSPLRIYQLLKSIISNLGNKDKTAILEQMAKKEDVEFGSKKYLETLRCFETNYKEIISTLKNNNIEIITCGVVRNLKDFKPYYYDVNRDIALKIINLVNNSEDDKKMLNELNSLANEQAELYYAIGKVLLSKEKNELAMDYFQKAVDYDKLRLRAPSAVNTIIEKLSDDLQCTYIDLQTLINKMDSSGIAGNDQILEHVHPDLNCHYEIACSLADTILNMYNPQYKNPEYQNIPFYRTIVEKIALTKILINLYSKFPLSDMNYFNKKGFEELYVIKKNNLSGLQLKSTVNTSDFALLNSYFEKYSDIDKIHLKYGSYLHQQKKVNEAYREFSMAYEQNPLNAIALNNMAVVRYTTGDKANGIRMQYTVYRQEPEYKTGLINLWLMHKYNNDRTEIKKIENELDRLGVKLSSIGSFILEEI
ncbi:MAG: hypothetical protein JW894_10320 [Bacteroidales bacterium]|nr:hypothetical protein [Bacteroidales bacterium]